MKIYLSRRLCSYGNISKKKILSLVHRSASLDCFRKSATPRTSAPYDIINLLYWIFIVSNNISGGCFLLMIIFNNLLPTFFSWILFSFILFSLISLFWWTHLFQRLMRWTQGKWKWMMMIMMNRGKRHETD